MLVDCTLIGVGDKSYFARTNGTYPNAEFVLIDCRVEGIPAEGWAGLERGNSDYVRYWEAGTVNLSDGKPADLSRRAPGSRVLDAVADSALINLYRNPAWVLGGWNPE